MPATAPRLLLVGGGHAHVEVLRRFRDAPQRPPPGSRVTLLSRAPTSFYSGALPGVFEGALPLTDAVIDVERLARAAGVEFVAGEAVAVDAARGSVALAGGASLPFDLLSLDVGAVAASAGILSPHLAIPARPVAALVAGLHPTLAAADAGAHPPCTIVGAGVAGVELAAALQARGCAVTLVAGAGGLLNGVGRGGRERAAGALAAAGVAVIEGDPVVELSDAGDGVVAATTAGGARFEGSVVLATGAAPPPWLSLSGLPTDAAGFILTDAGCECAMPGGGARVFAAGDCAVVDGARRPRAGAFAVRAGPVLAASLLAALKDEPQPPLPPTPPPAALALVSLGARTALVLRAGLPPAAGRAVWWAKRVIDKRFVDRYRV
jgi:selenide,water dikinase